MAFAEHSVKSRPCRSVDRSSQEGNIIFTGEDRETSGRVSAGFGRYRILRTGLDPKEVNPLTILVMKEVGINISNQRSKGIEFYLGKALFQYVITVCDDADQNCPTVWAGVTTRMHWSFEDPAKFEGMEKANSIRDGAYYHTKLTQFSRIR
jgi:hypothetical protein